MVDHLRAWTGLGLDL